MKSQNGIMLLHLVCYWPNFHVNIKFYAVCYYADVSKCCLRCFSFTFYLFVCVCVFWGGLGGRIHVLLQYELVLTTLLVIFGPPTYFFHTGYQFGTCTPSETNCLKYWAVSVIFLHLDLFIFLVYNEYVNLYVAMFYLFVIVNVKKFE